MATHFDNPGRRGKVGLILPSANTTTEPIFYALAPEGISFHTSRTFIAGKGLEDVIAMESQKDKAVHELASARLDCIADCCTVSGILRGMEADREFCRGITKDTGIPAISTLQAVIEALETLKVHKLVVTSPYSEEVEKQEKAFLEKIGLRVVNIQGYRMKEGASFSQVMPEEIYRLCMDAWDDQADGLFVSCMNFNPIPVISSLELSLKVPVISSNSATLWKILKTVGVMEPIRGYGQLLRHYL